MRTIKRAQRMVGGLIALAALVAGPQSKSYAQGDSKQENPPIVYFGEVVSRTDQIITLNVTPCQNTKTLLTISPYKITNSGEASCSGGRKYTRIAAQESKLDPKHDPKQDPASDKKPDKKDSDAKPKPETADEDGNDNK